MGHYSAVVYDKMKILLLFLLHICTIYSSEDLPPSKEGVRQPKILLVATNTDTGVFGCKKRREIMASYLDDSILNTDELIAPSRSVDDDNFSPETELDASRQGKFLNYFLTVTSIYTFVSYTATSTLASLICTPPGWTMHGCKGGQGK